MQRVRIRFEADSARFNLFVDGEEQAQGTREDLIGWLENRGIAEIKAAANIDLAQTVGSWSFSAQLSPIGHP